MNIWLLTVIAVVVAAWTVALIYFDIRQRRLPDTLTLPAGAAMLAWTIITMDFSGLWGLAWPLLYLLLALLSKGNGIGGGDIKLALPLGIAIALVSGAGYILVAMVITALIALLWGIPLRLRHRKNPQKFADPPNGPAMLLATAMVIFTPL